MRRRKYLKIVESRDDSIPTFDIGDDVIINGYVGMRTFKNKRGTIFDENNMGSVVRFGTGNEKVGKQKYCKYYFGPVYKIDFGLNNSYWVSPWEITLNNLKKIKKPELDPYNEEDWGYENESVKEAYNIEDFYIGQRVKYVYNIKLNGTGKTTHLDGLRGTIIKMYPDKITFGIQFNMKIVNGHDCVEGYGKPGKDGYCYWVSPNFLEPIDDENKSVKTRWYKNGKLNELKLSDFYVGQRVYHVSYGNATITNIDGQRISLEFDKCIGGHDCDGYSKKGHGYFVSTNSIKPIEDENKPVKTRWYKSGKLSENMSQNKLKLGDYVEVFDYPIEEFNNKLGIIIGVYHDSHDVKFTYKFSPFQWNCGYREDRIGLSRVIPPYNLKKISKEKYDKYNQIRSERINKHVDIDPLGEENWD